MKFCLCGNFRLLIKNHIRFLVDFLASTEQITISKLCFGLELECKIVSVSPKIFCSPALASARFTIWRAQKCTYPTLEDINFIISFVPIPKICMLIPESPTPSSKKILIWLTSTLPSLSDWFSPSWFDLTQGKEYPQQKFSLSRRRVAVFFDMQLLHLNYAVIIVKTHFLPDSGWFWFRGENISLLHLPSYVLDQLGVANSYSYGSFPSAGFWLRL